MSESESPVLPPNSLGPRLVSAAVLAPVVLAAVYYGGWAFTALVALMGLVLAFEWSRMVQRHQVWLVLGMVYIVLSCWALWRLRLDPEWGRVTVFWVLATVWGSDTGGYVLGRLFGGPKLAPTISPNKTWSGFLGGMLIAVLGGWGVVSLGLIDKDPNIGWPLIVFGAATSMVSQLGDLFESWVKRKFGVKDSGTLIPGHGGVFDRVDGLVAAAIAVAVVNIALKGNVLSWLS